MSTIYAVPCFPDCIAATCETCTILCPIILVATVAVAVTTAVGFRADHHVSETTRGNPTTTFWWATTTP